MILFLKTYAIRPPPSHIQSFEYTAKKKVTYKKSNFCEFIVSCTMYKTAEPIGPKFLVGHHVTTGKVY